MKRKQLFTSATTGKSNRFDLASPSRCYLQVTSHSTYQTLGAWFSGLSSLFLLGTDNQLIVQTPLHPHLWEYGDPPLQVKIRNK